MLAVGIIGGVLWGTIWWEERPLAEGERLLEQKESSRALSLAEQFLRDYPNHGRATALKARSLLQLGRVDEAARLFDQVGAASEEDMRDCAKVYLLQQRWLESLPVLEYLVLQHPHDPDLLHELSACRARLGRFDEAVESATTFAHVSGFEDRGFLLVGTIERERQNNINACDAWSRVVELNPEAKNLQIPAHEFFAEYGSALLDTGKPAEAAKYLQKSAAEMPIAATHATLGQAYLQLGKEADAEREWELAIAEDNSHEPSRQGLAELAMRQSDFRKVIDLLEPLADAQSITMSSAFLLQRAYTMAEMTDKASQWKDRVAEIRKQDELQHSVDQVLIESAQTKWGQALRAYRFAERGNWGQAEILVSPLLNQPDVHPFIESLGEAIRTRSALPDLSGIPLKLY